MGLCHKLVSFENPSNMLLLFSEPYHEALGNITPADVYYGRDQKIKARREQIRSKTTRLRQAHNCSLKLVKKVIHERSTLQEYLLVLY